MTKPDFFAHDSAVVSPDAHIGAGTRIWHFCHVMGQARIGSGCILGQNCFVASDVRLGNGVKVQNNVSLYSGVEVADDVFIGPSAVLTNVVNPRAFIERKDEFKRTLLGRGCTIGANATIICGTTIGPYAFVGAGAVVTRDVPPFALVVGNPARQSGWVGLSGGRLEFHGSGVATDPEDGRRYRLADNSVEVLDA
jgi:UDP-2-acetamido-3-amino-2,3-dideoxy-glucuronate N-acetyltransferase